MQSHLLETTEDVRRFTLAGNATLTFRSNRTDTRFTYKVQAPLKDNQTRDFGSEMRFVKVLTGADNESSYSYLGFIRRGVFFHGGAKAKVGPDAPSAKAFAWVWKNVAQGGELNQDLEVWHEGRCCRCGRKLTVPESIASGIGPDCAELMGLGGSFFASEVA